MELKRLAQHLEGQGRGGDTMLMHIQPTELQILESMLGKTTTNPATGLPEAFSWKKLLAGLGIAGAALVTGGAALPILMPLAGGVMASSLVPGKKKKEPTASEAGKYLDERTAQRVKDQYSNMPGRATMYQNPNGVSLHGEQFNHFENPDPGSVRPLGIRGRDGQPNSAWPLRRGLPDMNYGEPMAQGGLTEADAKKTVLSMLAQMQDQQNQQQAPGMSAGRMVRGGGTGLSDSIPAQLGAQPVRLADGEYVVPADVVSMMGDGSTDAGGRRLDDMIAKVRVQKTGTKKQAGKLAMRKMGK